MYLTSSQKKELYNKFNIDDIKEKYKKWLLIDRNKNKTIDEFFKIEVLHLYDKEYSNKKQVIYSK